MEKSINLSDEATALLQGLKNFKILMWYDDGTIVYGMDYRSTESILRELIEAQCVRLDASLSFADMYRITDEGLKRANLQK
jgi:hypothetical protein